MSLRIRRGTDAERAITPLDLGEIAYTTDTKQLYVGNGIDAGGTPIIRLGTGLEWADAQCTTIIATATGGDGGILSVSEDTNPSLGGDLSTAGFDISGTGNITTTAGYLSTAFLTINDTNIVSNVPAPSTFGYTVNSPITLGTTAYPATLIVNSDHTFGVFNGITDGTNTSGLVAKISRNTLTAPAAVTPGDGLFYQQGMGYDGTAFQIAGGYGVAVDQFATVSTGSVPGTFVAYTISSTGLPNYMLFDSAGVLNIPTVSVGDGTAVNPSIVFATDGGIDSGFFHPGDGIVCISTNAVERVRVDSGGMRVEGFMKVKDLGVGALPSPPEAGMIVLQNGTFQGYNGSSWVTLG